MAKYRKGGGATISSIGMFKAQMSSGSFQLLGMAELSLLPAVFARRTSYTGTPWVAIAASTVVMIAVSFLGFDHVANFLYSLGTLLEFASFWLRAKHLMLKRPYRVPLSLHALMAIPTERFHPVSPKSQKFTNLYWLQQFAKKNKPNACINAKTNCNMNATFEADT
uniref:Amino acid permease/ SLC12A domain-containing protein n=1 Tax=Aegilops tauschii TaxID=37682 RepID=M8BRR4_AEGTA